MIASRQRELFRLTKMIPLRTLRSSTCGFAWLLGKSGQRRSFSSFVSQYRSLVLSQLADPQSNQRQTNRS